MSGGVTVYLVLFSFIPKPITAQVYQKLLSLLDVHMGDSIREDGEELEDYAYQLHAFTDYHLGGQQEGGQGVKAAGNAAYVSLLAVIAGIVLLIACFNFMNLEYRAGVEPHARNRCAKGDRGAQETTRSNSFYSRHWR